jgi:hypothetical protein
MATVKLRQPIQDGFGNELTELEIKEDLKAGVLMAGDKAKGEVGKTFELLSAACGVPVSKLKTMALPDYMKAQGILDQIVNGVYGMPNEDLEALGEEVSPLAVPPTGGRL